MERPRIHQGHVHQALDQVLAEHGMDRRALSEIGTAWYSELGRDIRPVYGSLLREVGCSWHEVARHGGWQSHSSAHSGCNRHANMVNLDDRLRALVFEIACREQRIENGDGTERKDGA
jgi:hypothetical protein